MDVCALPHDVLASTLSMLTGHGVVNLLCTSKRICGCVRSIKGTIRVQSVLNDVADGLPEAENDITARMETGMEALQLCGEPYTTKHAIHTDSRWDNKSLFSYNRDTVLSIMVPATIQSVRIVIGGCCVLSLEQPLLGVMGSTDGEIDLMAFLKHCPLNCWPGLVVEHKGCDTCPALPVLTVSRAPIHHVDTDTIMRWRFLQLNLVLDHPVRVGPGAETFRFQSEMASLGHIIIVKHEGRERTDLVQSFALSVGDRRWDIPGSAAVASRIPEVLFNCPVKLRNCYYLPLWGKVNCSQVSWLKLQVVFQERVDGWIGVYNLRPNSACVMGGLCGVTFR